MPTRILLFATIGLAAATTGRAEIAWQIGEGDAPTIARISMTIATNSTTAGSTQSGLIPVGEVEGNAAPIYRQAIQGYRRIREQHGDLTDEVLTEWYDTTQPVNPASVAQIDVWLAAVRQPLETIHLATRQRHCDWQLGEDQVEGVDLYRLDVSDIAEARELSKVLNLSARRAISRRDYIGALRDIRANLRLCAGGPRALMWSPRSRRDR